MSSVCRKPVTLKLDATLNISGAFIEWKKLHVNGFLSGGSAYFDDVRYLVEKSTKQAKDLLETFGAKCKQHGVCGHFTYTIVVVHKMMYKTEQPVTEFWRAKLLNPKKSVFDFSYVKNLSTKSTSQEICKLCQKKWPRVICVPPAVRKSHACMPHRLTSITRKTCLSRVNHMCVTHEVNRLHSHATVRANCFSASLVHTCEISVTLVK